MMNRREFLLGTGKSAVGIALLGSGVGALLPAEIAAPAVVLPSALPAFVGPLSMEALWPGVAAWYNEAYEKYRSDYDDIVFKNGIPEDV